MPWAAHDLPTRRGGGIEKTLRPNLGPHLAASSVGAPNVTEGMSGEEKPLKERSVSGERKKM